MSFYMIKNSYLLLPSFNKLLVGQSHERTGAAFSFGGLAIDSLLIVELLVAFGAFHFAPKEYAHDGSYGCSILDVFKERGGF